jgi:putative mRNA 3-end processing factor
MFINVDDRVIAIDATTQTPSSPTIATISRNTITAVNGVTTIYAIADGSSGNTSGNNQHIYTIDNIDNRIDDHYIHYVSHAHSDHAVKKGNILSSKETYSLLTASGRKRKGASCWIGEKIEENNHLKLFNAGHILGATQLYVENGKRIVFTGDMRLRDGFTTEGAPILQCDVLYIDCTFGEPSFVFPGKEEIAKEIHTWLQERLKNGSVIFGAYRLGKAQELIALLNECGIIPIVDPSIEKYCQIYEQHGVRLERVCVGEHYCNHIPLNAYTTDTSEHTGHGEQGEQNRQISQRDQRDILNDGGNFVAIYPFHQVKNRAIDLTALKTVIGRPIDIIYPALVTGWAKKYKFGMPAFPLSDHADFNEIIRYSKESGASKVICMYASSGEIVQELRKRRINARLASW